MRSKEEIDALYNKNIELLESLEEGKEKSMDVQHIVYLNNEIDKVKSSLFLLGWVLLKN